MLVFYLTMGRDSATRVRVCGSVAPGTRREGESASAVACGRRNVDGGCVDPQTDKYSILVATDRHGRSFDSVFALRSTSAAFEAHDACARVPFSYKYTQWQPFFLRFLLQLQFRVVRAMCQTFACGGVHTACQHRRHPFLGPAN